MYLISNLLKRHNQSEMSPYDECALKILLDSFGRKDLSILEIGSWFGAGSTTVFSDYAERIICVDHWQGNENKMHRKLSRALDPFQIFKKNINPLK